MESCAVASAPKVRVDQASFPSSGEYGPAFKASGCPNKHNLNKGAFDAYTDEQAFNDMMLFCTLNRDGQANSAQQKACCGTVGNVDNGVVKSCPTLTCTKQS